MRGPCTRRQAVMVSPRSWIVAGALLWAGALFIMLAPVAAEEPPRVERVKHKVERRLSGPNSPSVSVSIDVGDSGASIDSPVWFCAPSFADSVCQTTINVGDTVVWSW